MEIRILDRCCCCQAHAIASAFGYPVKDPMSTLCLINTSDFYHIYSGFSPSTIYILYE